MKNRYNTIDFFKIIFCLGVVFGHTYCIFYQKKWFDNFGYEMTQIHNIFTDGFFICSGIFIAKSIEKIKKAPSIGLSDVVAVVTMKRAIRLWGGYMLSGALWILYWLLFDIESFKNYIVGIWTYPFFISCINNIPGLGSTWYVSALFWCGLVITGLLVYKPELSRNIILPMIFFLGYSFMYAKYSCDNLGGLPIVCEFISTGLVRGLCVISLGVELWFVAEFLGIKLNETYLENHKLMILVIEVVATLVLIYAAVSPGLNNKSFLLYPSFGILCILFLNHWEYLYNFCNNGFISILINKSVKYTYMIYLTQTLLLSFFKNVINLTLRGRYIYPLMMIACVMFGIVCYWIEYLLHAWCNQKIKRILK